MFSSQLCIKITCFITKNTCFIVHTVQFWNVGEFFHLMSGFFFFSYSRICVISDLYDKADFYVWFSLWTV